ncbi:hypothetical protein [Clostridium sp. M14]|uniref:hypothetical protein n=1 Tax=Clostridium sp. M14 TaxID=2716311 RepID=UPI0013EE8784|nr:hypothetical protein [Clostridium sp. M14]MBZ9693369.1 hypothetical protein [Clostridium sp. M14]
MKYNFEMLKNKFKGLINESLTEKEKELLSFINTILINFDSDLKVRKNMSINSFATLLLNSQTAEDFKKYLNILDVNKDYLILDAEGFKEEISFNEEYKKDDIEEYKLYKKFLDGNIKINNLYIIPFI